MYTGQSYEHELNVLHETCLTFQKKYPQLVFDTFMAIVCIKKKQFRYKDAVLLAKGILLRIIRFTLLMRQHIIETE